MSENSEDESNNSMSCASCGCDLRQVDDIKVRLQVDDMKSNDLSACKSIQYCSTKCLFADACKQQKEAELRDEILFRQPECNHHGDCPICCVPLPLDNQKKMLMSCCCKKVCRTCNDASQKRQLEQSLTPSCAFCRSRLPTSEREIKMYLKRRIEANDPAALNRMGEKLYQTGNYRGAFKHYTKAAELGNMDAHCNLALLFREGEGIAKDEKKMLYHLEEAAIGGNAAARYYLAGFEGKIGRYDRSNKHAIIAASMGHDQSLEALKTIYRNGAVSKEDFAGALRAHHAAVNATKSPERDESDARHLKLS